MSLAIYASLFALTGSHDGSHFPQLLDSFWQDPAVITHIKATHGQGPLYGLRDFNFTRAVYHVTRETYSYWADEPSVLEQGNGFARKYAYHQAREYLSHHPHLDTIRTILTSLCTFASAQQDIIPAKEHKALAELCDMCLSPADTSSGPTHHRAELLPFAAARAQERAQQKQLLQRRHRLLQDPDDPDTRD